LIARDLVRINGRASRKGELVRSGDQVDVERPASKAVLKANPQLHLAVLYSDPALLIVNKPGGMPCHPLRPDEMGTVMNAVAAKFPEAAIVGTKTLEGGLVHRLDNGTSGALMVAREAEAFQTLRRQVRSGGIYRRYLALVSGELSERIVLDAPVAHHPRNRRKMVVPNSALDREKLGARPALTVVEPLEKVGEFTLVAAMPESGARHQIRVHLATAGFPIVGDLLYGGAAEEQMVPERFFLHLAELRLESPAAGKIEVNAPLSSDLESILRNIR
jgi:23S rRNA pseudouridine1911/1915/1917 synthase